MNQEPKLEKIAEGREAEIFAWENGTVLRLMRSPDATQAVEFQAQALEAARAAGVSVPAVRGTATVDGRPGLIMDRIDGLDLLTLVGRKPWKIISVARVTGKLHAGLHEVIAPDHLPNLKEALARRISSSDLVPSEVKEFATSKLADLPDGDRLCHGDYHPGNVMENNGDPVVIDWTGVMRGDPMADFARTAIILRLGDPPPGSPLAIRVLTAVGRSLLVSLYRRSYLRHRPIDETLVRRWEAPVAANRLADNIEPEREKLLAILHQRMAEDKR